MTFVFLICAAIGGTILVCQFVMTLIGLGGEAMDIDVPDIGGDVDIETDFDVDTDAIGHGHVDSSWLFGVLSFRTLIAALAFFGLAGLAAQSYGAPTPMVWIVAIGAGVLAMYAVYWLMKALQGLKAEGTARIQRAVGGHGTVYVSIPADRSGMGKIQINLQNRTMEYLAQTPGDKLPPGAKVVVVDVITSNTVEVEPISESERNDDE